MKYKYIPGLNPTPMLSVFNIQNMNAFNDMDHHHNFYDPLYKHMWNGGSYMIYNDNLIISYAYNEFAYIVYLLRTLNKEMIIEVNDENVIDKINNVFVKEFIKVD